MGRISNSQIKRLSREIIERYGERFSGNYEANKSVLKTIISTQSKKLLNITCGAVTRLKKSPVGK